ncbi:TBC1 domain family member 14 isoform X2 [Stigmatopora nigra]
MANPSRCGSSGGALVSNFSDPELEPASASTFPGGPRKLSVEPDSQSLTSQDSGIPTLELNLPGGDSPATLTLDDGASAIPRGGGARRTLNRGGGDDDASVCSASSASTELSASNEDGPDFTVTCDSSAIVTLGTDHGRPAPFSDVSLTTPDLGGRAGATRPGFLGTEEDGKQKKLGSLAGLFNRSLFARKVKDSHSEEQRDAGWKLFGKVPPRQVPNKDPKRIQQEYERKSGRSGSAMWPRQNVRKNLDFEPLSTTALILEARPANLPAKSTEEAEKHRQEYQEMVAEAKKRELKEAQKRKKQLEERCKVEESIGSAAHTWNRHILPNWTSMSGTRRARELWWRGIPPSVRGKVWSLAMGNELNITHDLYRICLARAKEKWGTAPETLSQDAGSSNRESSLELIKLDISRTFPQLCIFQEGGPYHDVLHGILGAYTCYRPDVGYVQGMSFIAAVLVLNLDTADAFVALANLLNRPCQMAFFRVDHGLMLTYFAAFEVFFEENLPKLFAHFKRNKLTPDIYLIDWIFTLYSKSLPLDLASRVWDVFCRDGEEFLFRTALGLLRLFRDVLTGLDFIHMAQFLTRLPDLIPAERLFQQIAAVHMTSRNRKWPTVLQMLQRDPERGSPVPKP